MVCIKLCYEYQMKLGKNSRPMVTESLSVQDLALSTTGFMLKGVTGAKASITFIRNVRRMRFVLNVRKDMIPGNVRSTQGITSVLTVQWLVLGIQHIWHRHLTAQHILQSKKG